MSIKLTLLKSGERVISDIKEMISDDKTVGYFLTRPCVVFLYKNDEFYEDDDDVGEKNLADVEINLTPWLPLSKQDIMPVPLDWVVTIVEPVDALKNMYEKDVLKRENDQTNSSDKRDNVDISD